MNKIKNQINIARLIYDAYPHSDLLPIDPEQDCRSLKDLLASVTGDNLGDGLFRFIVVEIAEGGEGTLDGAIRVIAQAKDDVEAVLHALQSACVNYCRAAEYLAEQGRTVFVGPMNGGLWNGRVLDACIKSGKEGDKAAYEFLLKFGDQYAQQLAEDRKLLWQKIKDNAAAMLQATETKGDN